MYRVIAGFADLKDNGYVYRVGDIYPRKGEPDKERVLELSGHNNKCGMPLIEDVEPVADAMITANVLTVDKFAPDANEKLRKKKAKVED